MKFAEVLEIRNGKNQRQVENPRGKYPIYGSGGVMGYADDYICDAGTVVIGRKGSINNPIFVNEPFWNVDTAFGLVANKTLLLPKYLYYFCVNYNFEELNTTVTIPSLTKANLLRIDINLPELDKQKDIVENLDKICNLITIRQKEIDYLEQLVRSRFIELFGDSVNNPLGLPTVTLSEVSDIVSGITKGRKTNGAELFEVPYMAVSNVKAGYIDWSAVKTIEATEEEINQYRLQSFDVLMTEGGDPDKLGRGAIISDPPKNCIHQNHVFRVRVNRSYILPQYLEEYLQHQKAKQYFLRCAKQTTGIASINMKQLRAMPVLLPEMELQNQFATFVQATDKSKSAIKRSLDELEILKNSLMQQYFG
ncbi:MAG: restriction endonuclease subunit S [Clostridiales bacterium]|nr:restriction endonuclease subunit S [Clostridiales bacterium]